MPTDDSWMRQAVCRGKPTEWFFPEPGKGGKPDTGKAVAICKRCPARVNCLFYAVAHNVRHGVWGGLTDRQRRRIPFELKRRMRAAWFRQHPNSSPMMGAGYYLPQKRVRRGGE